MKVIKELIFWMVVAMSATPLYIVLDFCNKQNCPIYVTISGDLLYLAWVTIFITLWRRYSKWFDSKLK